MKTATYSYPKGLLCTFLILFSFAAFAQSATKLKEADEFFKNSKLKEAQEIYVQYANDLSLDQQSNLGLLYIYSDPAKKDYISAMQWFQKAAAKGHTKSMIYIASMYMDGMGVTKDTTACFSWYKKAADLKDPDAMVTVGAMYQLGKNVKADEKEALYWYKAAGEKGNAKGYYLAADIYYNAKLYNTAIEWYGKAAYAKNADAMLKLGEMYEEGNGVIKDTDEAARWYKKATRAGNYSSRAYKTAQEKLDKIASAMPSSDINVMKPILIKLATGATNQFYGLLGNEIEPNEDMKGYSIVSTSTYYKPTIATGLKNVYIEKEVVKDIKVEGYQTNAGTFYQFSADIIYEVDQDKADIAYAEWVGLLKASFPGFQLNTSDKNGKAHYFYGNINGKEVYVSLYNCCPARNNYDKKVSISITTKR